MAEKYKTTDGQEIVCQDLTYGFLLDINQGVIEETKHSVVMNGTGLSEEEVRDLRNSEITELYSIITRLTYPDLFDEDGNQISLDEDESEDDKKKA